jgi:glycine cleavage system transcriptional repressor
MVLIRSYLSYHPMGPAMASTAMISIFCPDRAGLIAAITGYLFDLGVNLGDTGFTVLGAGAEFNAVCEIPQGLEFTAIEAGLRPLPGLDKAEIEIRPFSLDPLHGPSGDITHQITISGGDQPGLVARLCETLVEFNANIVALNAGHARSAPSSPDGVYVIRLAAWIPAERENACLATLSNTAETLRLSCRWERV